MKPRMRLVSASKNIAALVIDCADVHVQSVTGRFKQRLGHKAGSHSVLFSDFDDDALEHAGFVRSS